MAIAKTSITLGAPDGSTDNGSPSPITPVIFSNPNAQSDGVNKLKRIEFEFQGNSYQFALNPEQYTQQEPSRGTLTQTKAGAWIDDFGAGVPTIDFQGTTGLKNGTGKGNNGFEKWKELRDLIRTYYGTTQPGEAIDPTNDLVFHNYTDGEHWYVYPVTLNLYRAVDRPLLYMYEVQLQCLRPAYTPSAASMTNQGAIGKIQPLTQTGNISIGLVLN